MGKPQSPPHGTVRRYRIELREQSVCDKCRAANSKAKADERANRKARAQRAELTIVPDPQGEPTPEPTPPENPQVAPPRRTTIPEGHVNLAGRGVENAVRNYVSSYTGEDLMVHVYAAIVIDIATHVIPIAEPKDVPKLVEQMVDAAKLMRPEGSEGGRDDPFAGLGKAT